MQPYMIIIQHPSGRFFVRDPDIIPDHAYSIQQVFMMVHMKGASVDRVSVVEQHHTHVLLCGTLGTREMACPGWHWVSELHTVTKDG